MLPPSSRGVFEPHTIHMPYLFSAQCMLTDSDVTRVSHVIIMMHDPQPACQVKVAHWTPSTHCAYLANSFSSFGYRHIRFDPSSQKVGHLPPPPPPKKCQSEAGVIDFGQLFFSVRPSSTSANFDFGQFRLRPISTSANFDFGQFDFGNFWMLNSGDKVWSPRRVGPRMVGPRRVEPRRVEPRRVEPRRVEPRRVGGPNFALFSPVPPQNSFFSSLSGSLCVEFWWCLKRRGPEMCTFGSSRAVVCEPRRPGLGEGKERAKFWAVRRRVVRWRVVRRRGVHWRGGPAEGSIGNGVQGSGFRVQFRSLGTKTETAQKQNEERDE